VRVRRTRADLDSIGLGHALQSRRNAFDNPLVLEHVAESISGSLRIVSRLQRPDARESTIVSE
jgi:hypothetical protein